MGGVDGWNIEQFRHKNTCISSQAMHNLAATHSSVAAAARLRKAKTAATPNNRAAKQLSRPSRLTTRTTVVGKHEASHSYSLVYSTLRDIQGNVDIIVNQQAVMTQPTNINSAISLFPLPHQMGAPYFDSKDATDFIVQPLRLT